MLLLHRHDVLMLHQQLNCLVDYVEIQWCLQLCKHALLLLPYNLLSLADTKATNFNDLCGSSSPFH